MILEFKRKATREELIERIKELEIENRELLTRLKADSLIERDKYWKNKIKKILFETQNETGKLISETFIPDISSKIFNDNREKYEPMLVGRNIAINAMSKIEKLLKE